MEQPLKIQEKRYAGPFVGLIYASLIALASIRGYFHLIELPWYVVQISYAAIIGLGMIWIFVTGNTNRFNTSLNVMLFQMIPHLIILVWSVALWVWSREPLSAILRGSSLLLYQLLLVAMLIFAGTLFGKKAIEYTSLGFIIGNTLILLDVMRRFGVSTTIVEFSKFILSAGSKDNTVSLKLEVQDLTFGMGIILAYYLVDGKDEHWRLFHILALGFFFILGLKRILFPALALAVAYLLITRRMSKKNQVKLSVFAGLSLLVISLCYVILIRTDISFTIMDWLGVNLMGRKRLYNHVKPYYTISPIYMGLGFGKVSKILEAIEITGNRVLHSDILRLYIEIGMPMFILWSLVTYVFTYVFFNKTYSINPARIYFAITLFAFVSFMTDNTIEKYCPQIAWHVLPLALILRDKEAFSESLLKKKNNPDQERRLQWVK